MDFTVTQDDVAQRMARAARIADRCAVAEIECEGIAEKILMREGDARCCTTWYDIRPMVDPRECSPESVDLARDVIDYALERGLAVRHPTHQHLLRIVRPGT